MFVKLFFILPNFCPKIQIIIQHWCFQLVWVCKSSVSHASKRSLEFWVGRTGRGCRHTCSSDLGILYHPLKIKTLPLPFPSLLDWASTHNGFYWEKIDIETWTNDTFIKLWRPCWTPLVGKLWQDGLEGWKGPLEIWGLDPLLLPPPSCWRFQDNSGTKV